MADMYGPVISNAFRVNDANAFAKWIAKYRFGGHDDVVSTEVEPADADTPAKVMLHGSEHYGRAWPTRVIDEDGDRDEVEVEMDEWTEELLSHLAPGEVFYLVGTGSEASRYTMYQELAISREGWGFRCASSDSDDDARRLIDEHRDRPA